MAHAENGKPLRVTDDEAESWHWADADGVVSIVDEWELVSSLSTGSLPHYTLVWREGWKVWLPACQVAELATSLPKEKVETAVAPGSDPLLTDAPPPPVDRYQAYHTREAAAKLVGKSLKPTARVPIAPPTGRPPPGASPTPPPPPPAIRPAQPTLVEGTPMQSTATLRPPGAVPPPPRGVPSPTPIAAPVAPVIQIKPSDEEAAPASTEAPTHPTASAGPIASAPLPSWSEDLDAEMRANARPAARQMQQSGYAPPPSPPLAIASPAKKGSGLVVGLIAVVGVGLIGAVAVGVVLLRSSKGPAPAVSATGTAGARDKSPLRACKLEKSAARLSPAILPSVTPVVASIQNGAKFAIGFAAGEREAEGIIVDGSSLAVERPFREKAERDITSVVPITAEGELRFTVDQADPAFRSSRTVDAKGRWTLGWTDQGLARRTGTGAPSTLWPGPSDKVTEPRVAPVAGGGFAVTARRGGQGGSVLVGLLDDSGEKKGETAEVRAKPQVGSPAIAVSDRGLLVAFAGRPTDESYWVLQVGAAPPGGTPTAAQSFATPPGGLGADAISPAVEGLSNGRWLLQWTEGPAGQRQVRIQTLGFDLVPVGDPLNLSPEGLNAGQGVVMVRGDRALSLFLVKKGKAHELWGATLSCP